MVIISFLEKGFDLKIESSNYLIYFKFQLCPFSFSSIKNRIAESGEFHER